MEVNKIYHDDWMNNKLADKSVQLIIADPPYYKVKGDFDFVWKTFDDYLQDVERWAIECKRVLADNGTLYWYGDAKNIAYAQIIFDKHFNLLNSLVWENTNDHKQQIRFNTDLRTFAPLTERLLMYEQRGQKTGGELIFEQFLKPKNPFSKYLKIEFKNAGFTNREIAQLFPSRTGGLTGCVSNWLNGDNVITQEQYNVIKEYCNNKYLHKPYEELKAEYEELRRPFNNERFYGDVIRIPNYETGSHEHDTPKPEKLTREIILISSRLNDLILVPFAGSGTECAMAIKENRNFIGFEINEKHVNYGNKRTDNIKAQPSLFAVS
jgi:site-specific DNA-methyltransferase (adenine-specific)